MPKLRAKLEAKRAERLQNQAWREAYEDYVATLSRTRFAEFARAPGDKFPDFMLPSTDGHMLALDDLLADGPLVITFYRGKWCPFCLLLLDALAEIQPEIHKLGARLVAITPDTGGRALEVRQRHKADYNILCDVDSGVGLACGVMFHTPALYDSRLAAAGVDLTAYHGNPSHFVPIAATFVVNRDGFITWRFIDVDFTILADPEDILAALRELA